MSKKIYRESYKSLIEILKNSEIQEKERKYREEALNMYYKNMYSKEKFNNEMLIAFYSHAHEIRSYEFLKKFGKVTPFNDHQHQGGCDFILNNEYLIECVCTNEGKTNLSDEIFNTKMDYYNDTNEIIYSRISSVIFDKLKKYKRDCKKVFIDSKKPFILFIGLGELAEITYAGKYGIELNKILIGKGMSTTIIDRKSNKVLYQGYSHINNILKSRNKKIDACNIFYDDSFSQIDAIILSYSTLSTNYNFNNTFMYFNPKSQRRIKISDFKNMIYWKLKDGYYAPYKNYKQIYR